MKKKMGIISVMCLGLFLLSSCGQQTDSSKTENEQKSKAYPLTISNYRRTESTAKWQPKEQVFQKAPERVMANTQPAAELLLHLGLKDKIVGVGAVFGEPDPEVAAEFASLNSLGKEYVSQEVALGTDPDFIYGRGGLFDSAEWGVGTVDSLNEMGIGTYVLGSSVTGGTYNSIYEDIENLGNIFSVQEQAKLFSEELKVRQATIEESLKPIKDKQSFALMFMTDPKEATVYPAGDESFFNDIFKMVKLENAYQEVTGEVSLESLIETDPDVLIIPDWRTTGGVGPDDIKQGLYDNQKLASLKAIKNKQVYAVDYNYMFGYGYTALDGMELLAKEIYPELLK